MFGFVNLTSGLYSKRRTEAHLEAQNGNTWLMPCRYMPIHVDPCRVLGTLSRFPSISLPFSPGFCVFLHLTLNWQLLGSVLQEELPPLEPEEEELDKVHPQSICRVTPIHGADLFPSLCLKKLVHCAAW